MSDSDLSLVIFYGLSSLCGIIFCIREMSLTKDRENFIEWFFGCLASLTPGIMLVTLALILYGIGWIISRIPNWLFSKLKRNR